MKEEKKLLLLLAGTALFIIVVGFLTGSGSQNLQDVLSGFNLPVAKQSQSKLKTIKVGDHEIEVTVADTSQERKIGLSKTKKLPENQGMLFVFDGENITNAFWMKGMVIPIDIIWINDGKVVKIDENAQPEPKVAEDDLKLYYPGEPIDYVLEVNAFFSRDAGIKIGDSVDLRGAI